MRNAYAMLGSVNLSYAGSCELVDVDVSLQCTQDLCDWFADNLKRKLGFETRCHEGKNGSEAYNPENK